MGICECGCGSEVKGEFLPGHDQRLRTQLEQSVGGLIALRMLVSAARSYAAGDSGDSDFTRTVRQVFSKVER